MDLEGGGDSRVQGVEELAELAGPLPAMALADHLAALGVERRKQGRRARGACSRGGGAPPTPVAWAEWAGPDRALGFGFLVDAEDQRFVRWFRRGGLERDAVDLRATSASLTSVGANRSRRRRSRWRRSA
jgi:hypothetical protein